MLKKQYLISGVILLLAVALILVSVSYTHLTLPTNSLV